jgi:hypothetical protein
LRSFCGFGSFLFVFREQNQKSWWQFPFFRKSQSRQETAVLRWLGFGSSADLQPKAPTPEQEQMKKVGLFYSYFYYIFRQL